MSMTLALIRHTRENGNPAVCLRLDSRLGGAANLSLRLNESGSIAFVPVP